MSTIAYRSMLVAATLIASLAAGTGSSSAQGRASPEARAKAKELAQVCRGDFQKLCPGVQPGGGRILACLRQHSGSLSQPCRDAMPK